MRALFLLVIVAAVLQGCWYNDGPMKQVGGAQINYAALDGLHEGRSTKSQALSALGPPSQTIQKDAGVELLEYVSRKRRESTKTFLKVPIERNSQSIEERVALSFEHGVLKTKEESSRIF